MNINEITEKIFQTRKSDTVRLLSPVSKIMTERFSTDLKEKSNNSLLKYLNPIINNYVDNSSQRSQSQTNFRTSRKYRVNTIQRRSSVESQNSSGEKLSMKKNDIKEQLKRYETIQNNHSSSLFDNGYGGDDSSSNNEENYFEDDESDNENPRTGGESFQKSKLSINDIQLMVRKVFSKYILNHPRLLGPYDKIFKGSVLQPEYMLRFKDNVQFEKFYNSVIQIFGDDLKFEVDERFKDLTKRIDKMIILNQPGYLKLINEWFGLGLTIAKIQSIELLSPLIFKILTIKTNCKKNQNLLIHYNKDLRGFNKHSKVREKLFYICVDLQKLYR